ncbi:MAG: hypothetical protein CFH16_01183, partial [Alphaproteobacteria bacterium MarineAlpha5_Bin6]
EYLKKNIKNNSTKVIHKSDLNKIIKNNKTDISILAIAGFNSLEILPSLFNHTKFLGIVNKECIVSAGHLFKKLNKNNYTKVCPLDSEHYSLNNLLPQEYADIKKIYLTASGGPFLNKKFSEIKNISLIKAVNHPKWKMGYKNSIDSATLMNKCLELIEAHYLFKIPYNKLDIVIHPESLIHSIIEYKNYTSNLNYFYHDMFIPLFNFLNFATNINNFPKINNKFLFNNFNSLNFYKPNIKNYPILNIFNSLDKKLPINLIKLNCANEFAVNLYIKKKINFGDIHKIISKSIALDLKTNTNNINEIIRFQKKYYDLLHTYFNK